MWISISQISGFTSAWVFEKYNTTFDIWMEAKIELWRKILISETLYENDSESNIYF